MTTQVPCADETRTDDHTQTEDLEEDVDMPDAPSDDMNHIRRPRKLDNRSGKSAPGGRQHFEEIEERGDRENRADRDAATRHVTSTTRVAYERTDHPRSYSARQESSSQRRVLVRGCAAGKSKVDADHLESRRISEDVDVHGSSHDVDPRTKLRRAEEEVTALKKSLKLLQRNYDEEVEQREKLEGAMSENETRLALAAQREEHLKISADAEMNQRGAELDSLQRRWENWRQKREIEMDQLIGLKDQLLSEKQSWVSEKEYLVLERQKSETALKRSDADLKDVTTRWKKMATELNSLRRQGQGFYQIDDNYLEEMIQTLRYNIRNFTIQYFSGILPAEPKFDQNEIWQRYMEAIVDGEETYTSYIHSPERRPSIVQAFLWRIVASEIHDNFRWAGPPSLSILDLYQTFNPRPNEDPRTPAEVEAIRKIYTWKATTVGLLLGAMDENQRRQADTELQQWKHELFKHVDVNLRQLQPEYQEKYSNDFFELIDQAVKLDEELCRQVSRVSWEFNTQDDTRAFDSDYMELEGGEASVEEGAPMALVVAPMVLKQGKSTGAGFESIVCLLKMVVSCEIPEDQE